MDGEKASLLAPDFDMFNHSDALRPGSTHFFDEPRLGSGLWVGLGRTLVLPLTLTLPLTLVLTLTLTLTPTLTLTLTLTNQARPRCGRRARLRRG